MSKYISEYLGTFALVFAGTGSLIVNDVSGGLITHVGISMTFGLTVMTMIYAIGDLSGAHINPAVTLGFCVAKRICGKEAMRYMVSQFAGAITASTILRFMFVDHETLGATMPGISTAGTFIFEVILTFLLMFVIIHVATGAKETGLMAGVAVGGTVCMAALFGGPITGASMNPARSLGPALLSGQWEHLWIYLAAPCIGAVLAILACRLMRDADGHCRWE